MKLSNLIEDKLKSMNLWHFIWMSVLTSEVLTAIMSLILRGRVTYDYLVTGTVVSLIVAGLVVLLIQRMRKIEKLAEAALQRANNELESRVVQRTAELTELNTQLNREMEERRAAQNQAESANLAKSQFLANMSHELRTPLNHILGFSQIVLDKSFGDLNSTQEEYLSDVVRSGSHLLSLINDALDLSIVEAGKLTLESSPVDLRGLVEDSLVVVRDGITDKSIQLITDIEAIPGSIQADERKLRQVMYNLLSNAVKFTPAGGRVIVAAQPCDSNGVEISVSDTGMGISQADLEKIFEPFVQVEGSKQRGHRGTGLGLPLSRSLIELHGGKLWAESGGKGTGSRFVFTLPGGDRP